MVSDAIRLVLVFNDPVDVEVEGVASAAGPSVVDNKEADALAMGVDKAVVYEDMNTVEYVVLSVKGQSVTDSGHSVIVSVMVV